MLLDQHGLITNVQYLFEVIEANLIEANHLWSLTSRWAKQSPDTADVLGPRTHDLHQLTHDLHRQTVL